MGKFSRNKGARGEREAQKFLGGDFKRTGYAGVDNPDLTSIWCAVSVKNKKCPISLKECLAELIHLEALEPDKHHGVMVKVDHVWIWIERAEQTRGDHIGTKI